MKKVFAYFIFAFLISACNNAADSTGTSDTTHTTIDSSMTPPAPATVDTTRLVQDSPGAQKALRK